MAQVTDMDALAGYGKLAFDHYVAERWDHGHAADAVQAKQQWDSLARAYLALTPLQRMPYHNGPKDYTPGDMATRVLAAYQTPYERNLSAVRGRRTSHGPVWLRTCYAEELADEYAALYNAVIHNPQENSQVVEKGGIFDDAVLYNYEGAINGWNGFLLRIPELCDTIRFNDKELYEELEEEEEEEEGDLSIRIVMRLYLADREALEKKLVKVLWLDSHGQCLWHNFVLPACISDFTGACQAMLLDEIIGYMDGEKMKGRVLTF